MTAQKDKNMRTDFSKFIKSDHSKLFINDQYGNKVFYPDRPGKGYIVPDKTTYNAILASLEYMDRIHLRFTVPLYIMLCLWIFLDIDSDILFVAWTSVGLAIILIGRIILISPKIRNLTLASDKANVKDYIYRQTCLPSFMFFLALPLLCILGIASLYLEYGKWHFELLTFATPFVAGLAVKLKHQKTG